MKHSIRARNIKGDVRRKQEKKRGQRERER